MTQFRLRIRSGWFSSLLSGNAVPQKMFRRKNNPFWVCCLTRVCHHGGKYSLNLPHGASNGLGWVYLEEGLNGPHGCKSHWVLIAYIIICICGVCMVSLFFFFHYENTPIQIYRKFHLKKTRIFSDKKLWYFPHFCSKHRLWVLVSLTFCVFEQK